MGHNYFGKSVAHVLRRFINDSEPISLKFCTGCIFKSNPSTGKNLVRPFDML